MERFNIELKKRDCSGIYAVTQRLMTYNSNKIAGSTLTEEQIAFLFDTGSLPPSDYDYRSEDIEEAHGHYLMFNLMMRTLSQELSEELIKKFHWELKSGVYNERINGRMTGEYRNSDIATQMKELLKWYHAEEKSLHPVPVMMQILGYPDYDLEEYRLHIATIDSLVDKL